MERYEKYKDSGIAWIGKIPEHWKVTILKRYCSITDGSHFSPKSQLIGKPYVSVKDIGVNNIDLETCNKISDDDFEKLIKNGCSPKSGDVLLTKDGTIGRAAIVIDKHKPFVVLSSLGIISPKNNILPSFLYFYLISGLNISQMYETIHGSALTRLTIEKIKNLVCIFPPLEEQKAIADYIERECDRINAKIVKTKRIIELQKEYRTALISEAVTGKIKVPQLSLMSDSI